MHEGLELLRISGFTEWQMGTILAIAARGMGQGTSVPSILRNLESSAEDDSSLARNVLAAYAAADQALQQMAAGAKAKHGEGALA
jgi:hypothetical protein